MRTCVRYLPVILVRASTHTYFSTKRILSYHSCWKQHSSLDKAIDAYSSSADKPLISFNLSGGPASHLSSGEDKRASICRNGTPAVILDMVLSVLSPVALWSSCTVHLSSRRPSGRDRIRTPERSRDVRALYKRSCMHVAVNSGTRTSHGIQVHKAARVKRAANMCMEIER